MIQHIVMLAQVCGLVKHFKLKIPNIYWNQVDGDWKRVSCHGNGIFYSHRCFSWRTKRISLPSFNGLPCKLTKAALFIYLILGWVYAIISHLICIFYPFFLKLKITLELMQTFANGNNVLFFFHGILCDKLKESRGKIWSQYHFKETVC